MSILATLILLQTAGPVRSKDGAFTMSLPKGFFSVEPGSPELKAVLRDGGARNPGLKALLDRTGKDGRFVLFAFERQGLVSNASFVDNVNVMRVPGRYPEMSESVLTQIAEGFKQSIPGVRITRKELVALPVGRVGHLRSEFPVNGPKGRVEVVSHVYFLTRAGAPYSFTFSMTRKSEARRAPTMLTSMRSLRFK